MKISTAIEEHWNGVAPLFEKNPPEEVELFKTIFEYAFNRGANYIVDHFQEDINEKKENNIL